MEMGFGIIGNIIWGTNSSQQEVKKETPQEIQKELPKNEYFTNSSIKDFLGYMNKVSDDSDKMAQKAVQQFEEDKAKNEAYYKNQVNKFADLLNKKI